MNTGDWYKFSVEKTGVYRISYDHLKKNGVDVTKVNPKNIKIFGREGGMLPQSNAISRPFDLMECAISVSGEADGSFDKGDYILFYAEGPDDYEFDTQKEIFRYENNLYSDKNFYFLTLGEDAGKRINVSKNIVGDYPVI
ncbi:MAG TPA: hypothetical protein VIQ51_11705, partial [Chryseosolibacter sp.]